MKKYTLYAVGEITLVVVGILIALSINNWNEDRIKREVEVKMLKELEIALNHDIRNIKINISSYERGNRSLNLIRDELYSSHPYHDSLSVHFSRSLFNNSVAPKVGPYETLKSKGLDLISNDSIRQKIIGIYEVSYKYYLDKPKDQFISESFFQEYCVSFFNTVSWRNDSDVKLKPLDFEALKNDQKYKTLINTRIDQTQLASRFLASILGDTEELKTNITDEIQRLE
jgi:hypothetical protein